MSQAYWHRGLRFAIVSETDRVVIELTIFQEGDNPNYKFKTDNSSDVLIVRGQELVGDPLVNFFYEDPPIFWFVNGASLEGNEYVPLKGKYPPYDASKIESWDWTGTSLQKESQGKKKDPESIQARVIRDLKSKTYDIVIDDDGKGELADVVTVRLVTDVRGSSSIEVEFYHSKYSHAASAGQRIEDLYELCGQAQKCISWMASPDRQTDIFAHLLRREARRNEDGETATRIEVGDVEKLMEFQEMSRSFQVNIKVFIVQPGLSKGKATRDQLALLSVTENHLKETYQLPFGVIASP